eukprot:9466549-Pyramimonas_sp.AAC.1
MGFHVRIQELKTKIPTCGPHPCAHHHPVLGRGHEVCQRLPPPAPSHAVWNDLAGIMRTEIVRHVIILRLHVCAQLVEGGGRDEVALTVDLRRGRARTRHFAGGARGGGAGVHGNVLTHVAVDNHSADQIRAVVPLIVDDSENLALNADLLVRVEGIKRNDA